MVQRRGSCDNDACCSAEPCAPTDRARHELARYGTIGHDRPLKSNTTNAADAAFCALAKISVAAMPCSSWYRRALRLGGSGQKRLLDNDEMRRGTLNPADLACNLSAIVGPNSSSAFASMVTATTPAFPVATAARSALRVSPKNESSCILCSGQACASCTLPS
jgi:hypothetical protein